MYTKEGFIFIKEGIVLIMKCTKEQNHIKGVALLNLFAVTNATHFKKKRKHATALLITF